MKSSLSDRKLAITPEDPRLANTTWLYCWALDPLGHCLCSRGSFHRKDEHGNAYGGALDCDRSPGKHPHSAFPHGVKDSLTYQQLLECHNGPGGSRRLAMCLQDVVMLDIDSEQALQSFYRIKAHVPKDKLLGIGRTPRGFHVLLHCPGWTQKAVNAAMKDWLGRGMWDGVDAQKISRRGMILDVRTSGSKYLIWPGPGARDRHWASAAEFRSALNFAGRGMPHSRMIQNGDQAPWNLEMTPELQDKIARLGADRVDRPAVVRSGDIGPALRELERWCRMLEQMDPESGRNNRLNNIAFYAGADAIAAGVPEDKVRARLLQAAARSNTPGAAATISSGLTSGADRHVRN